MTTFVKTKNGSFNVSHIVHFEIDEDYGKLITNEPTCALVAQMQCKETWVVIAICRTRQEIDELHDLILDAHERGIPVLDIINYEGNLI